MLWWMHETLFSLGVFLSWIKKKSCSITAAKFEREIIHGFKVLSCAKKMRIWKLNVRILWTSKRTMDMKLYFTRSFFFQRKRGDETEETKNIQRFLLDMQYVWNMISISEWYPIWKRKEVSHSIFKNLLSNAKLINSDLAAASQQLRFIFYLSHIWCNIMLN